MKMSKLGLNTSSLWSLKVELDSVTCFEVYSRSMWFTVDIPVLRMKSYLFLLFSYLVSHFELYLLRVPITSRLSACVRWASNFAFPVIFTQSLWPCMTVLYHTGNAPPPLMMLDVHFMMLCSMEPCHDAAITTERKNTAKRDPSKDTNCLECCVSRQQLELALSLGARATILWW